MPRLKNLTALKNSLTYDNNELPSSSYFLAFPCKSVEITFLVRPLQAKKPSGTKADHSPKSARAVTQSDQNLHCPVTESIDTEKYINGQYMSW